MLARPSHLGRLLALVSLTAWLACGCDSPDASAQSGARAPAPAPPQELTELTDVSAENVGETLRRAPGRVLLVNLWSTWCAPCMREMPMLVGVAERFRARGLGAAFVSMDTAANRDVALTFMTEQHAPSPSYIRVGRDADFIEALHPEWSGTLPATILFDSERTATRVWVGEVDQTELQRAIEAMLPGGT